MTNAIYTQNVEHCFAGRVGDGGLDESDYGRLLRDCAPAIAALRRGRETRTLSYLALPDEREDLNPLANLAARFRGTFSDILILGTGGSSLGGRAVAALADRGFGPPEGSPRVHFLDNVDPDTFDALFARLEPSRTGVFAISKSGGTAETLCQLAIVLERLRASLGEEGLRERVAVMTEPKDSPLARIAARFSLQRIDHDPNLGGRFSVLSTGALPAMLLGLDATALRQGAKEVAEKVLSVEDPKDAAPAVGAAIQVGLARHRGVSQSVLMPYSDRLSWFARWYRQLWAESLGKGGNGTTPVDALGTVDQHSQLQLYLDGPRDKVFTIMQVASTDSGEAVKAAVADHPDLAYLHDRRMGELLDAEAKATTTTLSDRGRPVRLMTLERLDEAALGSLFMHFMLETAIAAELLGVDAYDQPAVETGKRLTRQYLADARS